MSAQRKDDHKEKEAPQAAVSDLMRASVDAMETFMKTDWAKDAEKAGVKISPLMASPAMMMAAATAIGVKMTGQWASAFLNVMQESMPADAEPVKEPTEAEAQGGEQKEAEATAKTRAKAKVRASSDDLKTISGIGPKLASVLAARGIKSFAALAALDEAAANTLDEELGLDGRIVRDDWIGQAKAILAQGGLA